jgi:hypothetical protein
MRSRAVPAAVVLAAASLGCGRPDAGTGYTVTDSAGVTIVTNTSPAHPGEAAYRIAEEPLLDIGGDEAAGGSVELERVAGLVLMPDGGLVVADERASQILRVDATGRVLWRMGRAGDGPGEFRGIASVGRGPADSVWVFDFGNRRVTVVGPDGAPARSIGITAALSAPRVVGWLDDGTFVVREVWGLRPPSARAATGLIRDPAAVVRLPDGGSEVDTIGVFPGREFWMTVENGRGVMNTPLFSRNTVAAISGSTVVVGDQAAFDLRVFDRTGTLLRSIRVDGIDLTIDEQMVERATDALLEPIPEADRPAAREWLSAMPGSPSRPAFDRMIVTGTGEIWVSENVPPPLEPRAWYVLDAEGRWLGIVRAPARFAIESVEADRVAGIWRDEFDVEHARIYALDRPAASAGR